MEFNFPFYLFLSVLGAAGFFLCLYIYREKYQTRPMICPIGTQCDAVVHSEYAEFMGIPLERLGMFYYGLIAVAYGLFAGINSVVTPATTFILFLLSFAAFLFSCYLVFLQAVVLRQWCTWCLFSAGISTFIFAVSIAASEFGFVPLLAAHRSYITVFHVLFMAVGLGGTTLTDIFFFRFLKDFRISVWEADTLRMISEIMWAALAGIVITGVMLYVPEADRLSESPKFLVKILAVAVVIVNGSFLNLLIQPRLVKIFFRSDDVTQDEERARLSHLVFAMGAVSLVSWYAAFFLGAFQSIPLSFPVLLSLYAVVLAVGVLASRFVERALIRKAREGE